MGNVAMRLLHPGLTKRWNRTMAHFLCTCNWHNRKPQLAAPHSHA